MTDVVVKGGGGGLATMSPTSGRLGSSLPPPVAHPSAPPPARLPAWRGVVVSSQAQARALSQSISALGSRVKADVQGAAELREAVLCLVRSTESALHAFKRLHARSEAAKVRAVPPPPRYG